MLATLLHWDTLVTEPTFEAALNAITVIGFFDERETDAEDGSVVLVEADNVCMATVAFVH